MKTIDLTIPYSDRESVIELEKLQLAQKKKKKTETKPPHLLEHHQSSTSAQFMIHTNTMSEASSFLLDFLTISASYDQ